MRRASPPENTIHSYLASCLINTPLERWVGTVGANNLHCRRTLIAAVIVDSIIACLQCTVQSDSVQPVAALESCCPVELDATG